MAGNSALSAGRPEPRGATVDANGVNFAVASTRATAVDICLFDETNDRETARLRLPGRTGDVFHGYVAGLKPGQRYGIRAEGPFDPERGDRFNAHKLLADPHAAEIDRPFALHPAMFGYVPGGPDGDLGFDVADSASVMPKAIVREAPPLRAPSLLTPWDRTVIYELHVKGFTQLNPDLPDELRGRFAGLAHPASLGHLTRLGVTSIEVLPSAAWIDERHLGLLGLANYWGYNPVLFGAPDPRLAPGGWAEIAAASAALEAAGLELIVDMVLNHSGEGDELGPTLSLRGLDNAGAYRLRPDAPRWYVDDAGCGNTLAFERPEMLRLALDALRRWAQWGGVHGFRFDLATTLARRAEGFDPHHPLLAAIAQDPVLSRLKLIAEPWDIGPGGYQLGRFPAGWGEWNDRWRDTARRFWRGDHGLTGEMATRFAGSADIFTPGRRAVSRSINFVAAHDGFTLADLVSHAHKHNEANGEDNRDGTDANHSWNHGVEGPSEDAGIAAARRRDAEALLGTLILSRGTPMLSMGDELGRSQRGNNNAYAQDNAGSWLDWSKADEGLAARTAALLTARARHPALRRGEALTGLPVDASGIPDVVWLRPDGAPMADGDWLEAHALIAALYVPAAEGEAADRVVVALNPGHDAFELPLPEPRAGHAWLAEDEAAVPDGTVTIGARSATWIAEHPAPEAPPRRVRSGEHDAVVARLAAAAGIAPDWWDVSGRRTEVSAGSRRALLAAMGLPAATTVEARESLVALAERRDRAPLPASLVIPEGQQASLDLPWSDGLLRRLDIACEGGDLLTVDIAPGAGEAVLTEACDGRTQRRRRIALPPLPMGRHRLRLDDGTATELIAVPRRCHLPAIEGGTRLAGIAAHLYALRSTGDQGMGDLGTLAAMAREAEAAGLAVLGINPLHALFPEDRGRASPYHPGDRRFLDPLYIDAGRLGLLDDHPAVLAAREAQAAGLSALSRLPDVDYPAVWAAKRAVLAAAFAAFEALPADAPEAARFAGFVTAGGGSLRDFCLFQALRDEGAGDWRGWAPALRHREPAALAEAARRLSREIRFGQFQQWLAAEALARAGEAAAGLPLGLYRDLAVGCAPDGAEAWACQAGLARGVSIGAPPDPFAAQGQVWGLPPPNPLVLGEAGHRDLSALLGANMAHAGALRIDHVMGLRRLFWVPEGASAGEGAYVEYPFAARLGIVALESRRARCLVVGEDLGTVPEGFRETMAEARVLSYRVAVLERDGERFLPPRGYPALAAACLGTHDLPPLAGWWQGCDIAERAALEHAAKKWEPVFREEACEKAVPGAETGPALEARRREKAALLEALAEAGFRAEDQDLDLALSPALAAAIHGFAAAAPSLLILAQAEDLALSDRQLNLPGTDRERPNWRHRIGPDVASLLRSDAARAILAALSPRLIAQPRPR